MKAQDIQNMNELGLHIVKKPNNPTYSASFIQKYTNSLIAWGLITKPEDYVLFIRDQELIDLHFSYYDIE